MEMLIDDKISRFSYLNSYTIYCGIGLQEKLQRGELCCRQTGKQAVFAGQAGPN
jgi:hypothetical protein